VREELDELAAEIGRTGEPRPAGPPDGRLAGEVGDLLFTVVNLARRLNVDPELALRATTQKFRARVDEAVRLAADEGESWPELGLGAQERYYQLAKEAE